MLVDNMYQLSHRCRPGWRWKPEISFQLEVDKIVDRRIRRGKVEYLVRWKGFPPEQDSWEPFTSLKAPCLPLIHKFRSLREMKQLKRRFTTSESGSASHAKSMEQFPTDAQSMDQISIDSKMTDDESVGKCSSSSRRSLSLPRQAKKNIDFTVIHNPISKTAPLPIRIPDSIRYSGSISLNSNCLLATNTSESDTTWSELAGGRSQPNNVLDAGDTLSSFSVAGRTTSLESVTSTTSTASTVSAKNRRSLATSKSLVASKRSLKNPKRSSTGVVSSNTGSATFVRSKSSFPPLNYNTGVDVPHLGASSKPEPINDHIPSIYDGNPPKEAKGRMSAPSERITEPSVEPGRKSVTIMLKISPTEEFHNTKELDSHQAVQIPTPNNKTASRQKGKRTAPEKRPTDSHPKKKLQITPGVPDSDEAISSGVPDAHIASVMDIVLQMRESHRRPTLSLVTYMCHRRYILSPADVQAALNVLVAQGYLHEIPSTSGLSYRTKLVVARGDLVGSASLSKKIKAKYVGVMKQKKKSMKTVARRALIGAASKRTVSKQGTNSMGRVKAPKMEDTNPLPSKTGRSMFGRALKSTNRHSSEFTGIVDGVSPYQGIAHAPGSREVKNERLTGTNPNSMCEMSGFREDMRILTPPTAIPSRESDFARSSNQLGQNVLSQEHDSRPGTQQLTIMSRDPSTSGPVGNTDQSAELSKAAVSRRSSVRQTEAAYKFKSILVKKNTKGSFTEVWLQSPGSPMKNAFTIQVLEELTAVLNQAVYDTSRLVMISGMGTVFSSGIDLTLLTGPLPPPNQSSMDCTDAVTGTNNSATQPTNNSNVFPYGVPGSSTYGSRESSSASDSKGSLPQSLDPVPCSIWAAKDDAANRGPSSIGQPPDRSMSQQLGAALRAFLLTLVGFPKLVVAGVNGPAMGLAVAMLPLCDLVYVSDAATFQLPYTRLGQTPEGGASFTLSSLIGLPMANELLLAGRKISAREAMQRGFVSDLLYPKSFKQELVMRCHKLATTSSVSLEMTKRIVRSQHRDRVEHVINTECRKLVELWQTMEFRRAAIDFLSRGMGDFV